MYSLQVTGLMLCLPSISGFFTQAILQLHIVLLLDVSHGSDVENDDEDGYDASGSGQYPYKDQPAFGIVHDISAPLPVGFRGTASHNFASFVKRRLWHQVLITIRDPEGIIETRVSELVLLLAGNGPSLNT